MREVGGGTDDTGLWWGGNVRRGKVAGGEALCFPDLGCPGLSGGQNCTHRHGSNHPKDIRGFQNGLLPCPILPTSCLSDAAISWVLSCQSQNVPPSLPSPVLHGTDRPRENKLILRLSSRVAPVVPPFSFKARFVFPT